MSQLIQLRRGLEAALPSSAAAGEPLFCTDSYKLFMGTGTGVVRIKGTDENVKVGATGTEDYLNENYFEQDGTNHIRIKQNTKLTGVNVDQVDGKDVDDTESSTSYLWTAAKIIAYVDSVAQGLDWQNSVLDMIGTPPGSPSTGDRYLITTGTGDWSGKDNQITEWNGTAWVYAVPNEGFATYVEDVNAQYVYNGTAWVKFGSTTAHNETSGLQGGTTNEYYHLTSAQHSGLTGGSTTTLHGHDTDNLTEGTTNLFFTDARAQAAISVSDTDSIDLSYSSGEISADVKVDDSTIKIDATNHYIYVNLVDGGSF